MSNKDFSVSSCPCALLHLPTLSSSRFHCSCDIPQFHQLYISVAVKASLSSGDRLISSLSSTAVSFVNCIHLSNVYSRITVFFFFLFISMSVSVFMCSLTFFHSLLSFASVWLDAHSMWHNSDRHDERLSRCFCRFCRKTAKSITNFLTALSQCEYWSRLIRWEEGLSTSHGEIFRLSYHVESCVCLVNNSSIRVSHIVQEGVSTITARAALYQLFTQRCD